LVKHVMKLKDMLMQRYVVSVFLSWSSHHRVASQLLGPVATQKTV
jgi:hypothetical protein